MAGLWCAACPNWLPAATINETTRTAQPPEWLTRPLSLADAVTIALGQNATIEKAQHDLEAAHGIVIQTRAVVLPRVQAGGTFTRNDPGLVDRFPFGTNSFSQPNENWNTSIQVVQSVYEGGRMRSALRTARLTREQALLQYQTVVSDVLLATRIAYYDVLVAAQQITVNEASLTLLQRELEDQQRRYTAGTVPRFNVLRAEVAAANQRPNVIRARNAYRIGKNNLANLLGYDIPRDIWEDIPMELTETLDESPYEIQLPAAIAEALEHRTELAALRKVEQLEREGIVTARAGYKPSLQAFAGYGWRNSQFTTDLSRELDGWNFGGQVSWNLFDGMLTRGRVVQARAEHERSVVDLEDTQRRIELEVRTAYSTFVEARELLDSQQKVQEEADEALRLAGARAEAGTGTQLDVLNAETSLTQARTTRIQALHDYAVARARLERALGRDRVRFEPEGP
jgi:outer membrane protein TolC